MSISFRSEMMCKCWLLKAEDRPSFSKIVAFLSTKLESLSEYLDLVISNKGAVSHMKPKSYNFKSSVTVEFDL